MRMCRSRKRWFTLFNASVQDNWSLTRPLIRAKPVIEKMGAPDAGFAASLFLLGLGAVKALPFRFRRCGHKNGRSLPICASGKRVAGKVDRIHKLQPVQALVGG